MNRSDFLRMIENSGPSDRQTISEVNELINIFPYFQSAYRLLLKGLQNTSDVKFENQLRVSAMHIANREVLYYFLRKEVISDTRHESPVAPHSQIEVSSADSQQTVIESGKNSTDLINEIEKKLAGDHDDEKIIDRSILISNDFGNDDSSASIMMFDEESGDEVERITYMDPGFSVSGITDLLELDINENRTAETGTADETATIGYGQTVTPSIKDLQSALIDKFIDENPRIEPSRGKSAIPNEDISKPFKEEKEEFVTETLARIYIGQGYYSKAINIYEKLSLKFPEKSSYFASQIEKVKELIKK
jgi:hypothetical protein